MTKVIFVRHGEPDYSRVTELGFKGHGRDLAHLTKRGVDQANAVAKDARLLGADVMLSSPYTRALQTASIISKETGHAIEVVTELHEWLPDLSFDYTHDGYVGKAVKTLSYHKGECPGGYTPEYESLKAVFDRVKAALQPYLKYDKIIVVCHGVVMRQFMFAEHVEYCGVLEVDMDETFEWSGFVEN